ncbi:ATP-binding protein [Metabacillus sediminilitoris]|uniref:histidine kinase n=1 Tax=Metabacillus sediminilitoris TaxID=2567941 RepID=A0A4S4C3N0_9BACI|nr:ATP-binding protein [Metabacillus sediminilitoris]QGQ44620.1 GHKL domain-containing protein [Metabacillus sediminilitoris]THF80247.1 GHKL domain-containing protein [Metabacillus sediminilitoris]
MKERIWILLLMMIAVPLAGEFKFYPFDDTFRVSLGTPAFFLFLLWGRGIHPNIAGMLTGMSVFVFRFLLAVGIRDISVEEAMYLHFPAFFYYVIYALLFHWTKMNERHDQPFMIGFLGVGIEIIASLSEMVFRSLLAYNQDISLLAIEQLVIIAFIRSFFVLGFFNIFKLREAKLAEEEQRMQKEKMLLFISNLYEESVHLKKTMQNAEEITRMCYDFYRRLKSGEEGGRDAQTALQIAGLVHEIKKDNQRIYAGVSELISSENMQDYMNIKQLGNIMLVSNRRYAESLGKDVSFTLHVNGDHPPYHVFMVLSIINNLLTNAVEAIREEGYVSLHIKRKNQFVEFSVSDNGSGIPPRLKEIIFTEGFTTKFDVFGNPSTGIGLSYVKHTVEKWGGHIMLMDNDIETVFIVRIPIEAMIEKGLV